MYLPILSAAVVSVAAFTLSPESESVLSSASSRAEGALSLVGQPLWASEAPVEPWLAPVRAEDLTLEGVGTVADLRLDAEGRPEAVTVAVGGLWGWGAEEVTLDAQRLHLVPGADGQDRLVLDLSSSGAEPPIDGAEL